MNKNLIFGILLVVIVALITSFFVLNNVPPQTPITNEEYNVYSALINSKYMSDRIELIVIQDNTTTSITVGGDFDRRYVRGMPELQRETIENFKKINHQSYLLKRQFNLELNYILISQDEMKNIFKKGYEWDDFYKKYPNSSGIIILSRVGFNSQKDQALVYISRWIHRRSAAGYIVFLVKENNVWKIKERVMIWIS
jgi:hypothetical protein